MSEFVCVCMSLCVCATCMSKQLSQIYSLAQVSTCYLAHSVWLCISVCLCVCATWKECALSKSILGTYLKSPCCWYIQLFNLVCVCVRQRSRPHLACAKMQHYADDLFVFLYSASHTVRSTQLGCSFIKPGGDFLGRNDPPRFGQFLASQS